MSKSYLSILVGLLLIPAIPALAVNDLTLDADSTIISVGGYNLVVTAPQRVIDSITANDNDFTVTLFVGATFGVKSADRRAISVTPLTYVVVSGTCTASESSVNMTTTHNSGSATVTVTPSQSNTCETGGAGSNTGTGGGSGGGGGAPGAVLTYGTPASTPTTPAPSTSVTTSVTTTSSVTTPPPFSGAVFNSDLSRGMENNDVRRLQELLARDKSIYPEGSVIGIFGPATERAVRAFQARYGLPQVGRVGPATRAKLLEVFGGVPSSTQVSSMIPSILTGAVFTSDLSRGMENDDVRRLQELLARDKSIYPEGSIIGYFGPATERAVRAFQARYGISQVGRVGPQTRAKLLEVFGATQ